MTPLLLLDVDGVLNALSDEDDCAGVWPEWRSGYAWADDMRWPIAWAPAVVERLLSWREDGRVEVQWLTTWGHDANNELRLVLGMPRLEVAGTYAGAGREGAAVAGAPSHAAVSPSAPDPLSGQWWKYDVVRRILDEQPGRLLIWVDDELHETYGPFRHWAELHPRVRPIGPNPMCGLSPHDMVDIEACLEAA